MADFEQQLNAILSSPESMQQVAQLAQMLASGQNGSSASPVPEHTAPEKNGGTAELSSLLGDLDLATISRFLPLLQELKADSGDERTQLLYALKPFLTPERQEKIDSALRIARLLRVGKTFFKGFGESHV